MVLGRLTLLELASLCHRLDECVSCPFYNRDLEGCIFREGFAPSSWNKYIDLNENI